jgi:hypothetical protein
MENKNICDFCRGSGKLSDGRDCPACTDRELKIPDDDPKSTNGRKTNRIVFTKKF